MNIQAIKGMNDLFGQDLDFRKYIECKINYLFQKFGFNEIRTPVLEESILFKRTVGTESDIIEKEMYTFKDVNNKFLSLRPENTAGVVRALIESNMILNEKINKLYYIMPMFRRENPQKGRLRQFYQIGVEYLGDTTYKSEIEIFFLLYQLLKLFSINNICFHINTLGTLYERKIYSKILKKILIENKLFCETCKKRIKKNPLRVFDCKEIGCKEILKNIPKIIEVLGKYSIKRFNKLKKKLKDLSIPYIIDEGLVRGLDYYTGTVFELVSYDNLGTQNAMAAGGRYNYLINSLGKVKRGAVGFSIGFERLLMVIKNKHKIYKKNIDIYFLYITKLDYNFIWNLVINIKRSGLNIYISEKKESFKSQMKKIKKLKAESIIVIGEDEIKRKKVRIQMLDRSIKYISKLSVKDIINSYILLKSEMNKNFTL